MNKPRKLWIAALLTLCTVGLGHIYGGNPKKGIILFIGQQCMYAVLVALLLMQCNQYTFFLSLGLPILYIIAAVCCAVHTSWPNRTTYTLRGYNNLLIYISYFLLAGLIIQSLLAEVTKNNYLQAFVIPSDAMKQTLLPGDFFLVDKCIYKKNIPERGDIVLFTHPDEPEVFLVKRIVAGPGDTIEIQDKVLYLNDHPIQEPYAFHPDKRIYPASVTPRDNLKKTTIQKNTFFLLGDNRDNSLDSRFKGAVPRENILGKGKIIYFSKDRNQNNLRLERMGKILE